VKIFSFFHFFILPKRVEIIKIKIETYYKQGTRCIPVMNNINETSENEEVKIETNLEQETSSIPAMNNNNLQAEEPTVIPGRNLRENLVIEGRYWEEVSRLSALRRDNKINVESKLATCELVCRMFPNCELPEELKLKKEALKNWGDMTYKFMTYKILLWTALAKQDIKMWKKFYSDAKINEYIDEWIQSSWEYLGMENIEEDTKTIKEEFHFFKLINQHITKFITEDP
jgi:hypothetical protein